MSRITILSKKHLIILFLFYAAFFRGFAQNGNLCDNLIPFGKHLFETGNYHDILQVSHECSFRNYDVMTQDSLNFMLGNALLKLNQTDSAISTFLNINTIERFRMDGIRMGLNEFLSNKAYLNSLKWLESPKINAFKDPNLAYHHGGLYLMTHDFHKFDSLMDGMPVISIKNRKLLQSYRDKYEHTKMKSPWLAGLLSTAVPGLGKMYSGKTYQGISAFITVGIFALQAWEAYYRKGIKSPVLYVNGTLAVGYYLSNIWGSVMAVKIKNREVKYEIDEDLRRQLYFDL